MTAAGDIDQLVEERPDLKPAIEAALEAHETHGTWSFEEIGVDSGSFGELVSRGVVEKVDGEYRLAAPRDARSALGSGGPMTRSVSTPSLDFDVRQRVADFDAWLVGSLTLALVLVVAFRVTTWNQVFIGGDIVLTGNDPWFYRYWVDQTVAAGGRLDFSGLATLPEGVTGGEPLLVAVLWLFTAILGGSETASGVVLAFYPIVAALLVGLLTYLFTRELTDDRRIAVMAVVVLAVLPVHAQRSGLGYADHHAFDFVWLTLTAASAVYTAKLPAVRARLAERPREVALGACGVGGGVAGQTLAWEAGPLLLVPLALYFPIVALLNARESRSPLWASAPLLAGLAVGALLSALAHLALGWHSAFVAFAPAIVFGGGIAVTALAEAIYRYESEIDATLAIGAALSVGLLGFLGIITYVIPSFGAALFARVGILLDSRPIVEYQPLFSLQANGWLILLGPPLVVAIPGFVWAALKGVFGERRYLVAALYAFWLLVMAALQQRFAGELSPFVASFAGFAVMFLAWKVDVANPPAPLDPTDSHPIRLGLPSFGQIGVGLILLSLVGGYGVVQSPNHAAKAPYLEGEHATAAFAEAYAAENDLEYPENYVLSKWWRNRMYNYLVSGESAGYTYARENYVEFLRSTNPTEEGWYEEFDGRVGFVLLDASVSGRYPGMIARLQQGYGSRVADIPGSAHYRLIYEQQHPEGSYQLFQVVPGAELTGTAAPNSSMMAETRVTVDDTKFTYRRLVETDSTGTYSVRLAYPGRYSIGNQSVEVTSDAVDSGETVSSAERV
jgi:dolichyl-diphosphooligosaccharide--protein glycosyltransferase